MTKLEKLIQELCPEGVEYKEISEVTNYEQPSKYIVKSTAYRDEYEIPVLTAGQSFVLGYTDESDGVYPASKATPVIIFDDFTAAFKWVVFPFKVKSSAMKIITAKEDSLLIRFLFHWMGVLNYSSTEHTRLWIGTYSKFRIPVPPLPVQREIVRILDNFTELTARKRQYAYYRDKLLTFAAQGETILTDKPNALNRLCRYVSEFIFVKLSDISVNCDNLRKPVTSGNREAGNIPYYGASGIVDYVKDYIFDGDYLLISEDGANLLARNTPIAFSISGKNWVNNHAHILRFNNRITQRYVEIYLNSIDLSPYISGGAQPKLNQQNLYKIPIPLPSYQKQKEIVTILDRFDTLCTDLSSGLPAEIEARQKQYEYYRDKLLSFEEKI